MKTYSMHFILFKSYHVCTNLFTKHIREKFMGNPFCATSVSGSGRESQAEGSSYPLWWLAWGGWWWLPRRRPPAAAAGSPWSPTCPSPPRGNGRLGLPSSPPQGSACGKELCVHKLTSFKLVIAWEKWRVAPAEWPEIAYSCTQQSSGIWQHTVSRPTQRRLDLSSSTLHPKTEILIPLNFKFCHWLYWNFILTSLCLIVFPWASQQLTMPSQLWTNLKFWRENMEHRQVRNEIYIPYIILWAGDMLSTWCGLTLSIQAILALVTITCHKIDSELTNTT